jgi:hypothetical protein
MAALLRYRVMERWSNGAEAIQTPRRGTIMDFRFSETPLGPDGSQFRKEEVDELPFENADIVAAGGIP